MACQYDSIRQLHYNYIPKKPIVQTIGFFGIPLIRKFFSLSLSFPVYRRLVLPTIDSDGYRFCRDIPWYVSTFEYTPFQKGRVERIALVSTEIGSDEHEDGNVADQTGRVCEKIPK